MKNNIELTKTIGVYQIRCLINSFIYVGSTITSFSQRWKEHRRLLSRKGKHSNRHLQNAWNCYGEENFVFEILEIVEEKIQVTEREQYYLDTLKPHYNICPIANTPAAHNKGKRQSRFCKCGKPVSEYYKDGKFFGYNKTCNDPECISTKGISRSEEIKEKIKLTKSINPNPLKGKPSWNSGKIGLQVAWNKDRRQPRLCECGNPVKEYYSNEVFKKYGTRCIQCSSIRVEI